MKKGKIYLTISAFIYGITPVLAKAAYSGGANGMTVTFYRAFLSLPLLFLFMRRRNVSIGLSGPELRKTMLLSVFGNAMTIICLYISYDMISIGLATVLHYIYPLLIVIFCAVFYKEKMTRKKILATILVTVGILLFMDFNNKNDVFGIIFALLSGVFYAFNVIYMDKSGLDKMDYIKLTFYISLFMSASVLLVTVGSGQFTFAMTKLAWISVFLISLLISLFALPLFQMGVLYEGASTAGILSTVEPITGVVMGAVFLNEKLTLFGTIGCILILLGVILIEHGK